MNYWSPKHVERMNFTNKINHQILCILSDYIYIYIYILVTSVSKHPVTVNVQAARSGIRLHLVAPSDNTKWITEAMRAT